MPNAETWASIPRFGGRYDVSSHGRLRRGEKILQPGVGDTGYRAARLVDADGHRRLYKVHRLVLEAFVGSCPEGQESRHLDGDRLNNHLENLAWGTRSENAMDRSRHGTNPMGIRRACPRGHLLAVPNLDAHMARKGYRSCKSCMRARSWAHGRPDRDWATNADQRYLEIMEA